jgi:carbamate kinase
VHQFYKNQQRSEDLVCLQSRQFWRRVVKSSDPHSACPAKVIKVQVLNRLIRGVLSHYG